MEQKLVQKLVNTLPPLLAFKVLVLLAEFVLVFSLK